MWPALLRHVDRRSATDRTRGSRAEGNPKREDHCECASPVSAPASLTAEQYGTVVAKLDAAGISPAEGRDYEICFGSGDNFKVSMVWDSQEQLDAFGARLGPILAELGIDPGDPEIVEVHNIIRR